MTAFLKAHGFLIGVGVAALVSLGAGGWAYVSGSNVERKMKDIDGLVAKLRRFEASAANKETIEAKARELEKRKAEFDQSKAAALARQKYNAFYERIDPDGKRTPVLRDLLVPNVLPRAKSAVRIEFKEAYRRAFKELYERLRARGRPTPEEIALQRTRIEQLKNPQQDENADLGPYVPRAPTAEDDPSLPKRERDLAELLRESPKARAADEVARSVYMYAERRAFGAHHLAEREGSPSSVDIWQAEMSLWIQQDVATALARCNEERAEELRRQGVKEPFWVAQMPVKHLLRFSIDGALGDGGGSGSRRFAKSFTGIRNNDEMFVVPLRLELVIEEAALMNVLEKICQVGFYTPTAVSHRAVEPAPLFLEDRRLYIYGEDPVIQVTIDLEGYYFREVFEQWIPKKLKDVLKKDYGRDRFGGRG